MITGHGLKDPDAVERIGSEIVEVDVDVDRRGSRLSEAVRVRAPATTANLGPGFDCAAAAFDLWNELTLTEGGEPDREHLGVRAFALLADPSGYGFEFTVRIPRERGLGSSASIIALGLAAATVVNGDELDPERLLALGLPLEGHADNLAAALAGGVCLTWDGRIARIAESLPCTPIAVVPESRVLTAEARASLPEQVSHRAARGHGRARGAARRRDRRAGSPTSSRRRCTTSCTSRTAPRPRPRSRPCGTTFRPARSARRSPARARR